MSPALKFSLGRLGIFFVALLILWPIGSISLLLKLMIALLVSAVVSWFALRGLRDDLANHVEQTMDRRREEKERLQAALAGDDVAAEALAEPPVASSPEKVQDESR